MQEETNLVMKTQIEGFGIKIRKIRKSDAEAIAENINDKELIRRLANPHIPYPYKVSDARSFIAHAIWAWKKGTQYVFAVEDNGEFVGIIDLHEVDKRNKKAAVGAWLGRKYWGKGYGTKALKLILQFAFKELKLHRVEGIAFEWNVASRRIMEKVGFKFEGMRRESFKLNGKYQNEVIYGILRDEFKHRPP